jgi:hypothetical protein
LHTVAVALVLAFELVEHHRQRDDVHDHLLSVGRRGGTTEHAWSKTTLNRVAAALLKIAVDFGLLRGSVVKEFASYHLPERSFLYLLYALREEARNPRNPKDFGLTFAGRLSSVVRIV